MPKGMAIVSAAGTPPPNLNPQPHALYALHCEVGIDILKNQIRTCMFSGPRMSDSKAMSSDAIDRILLVRLGRSKLIWWHQFARTKQGTSMCTATGT